MFEVCLLYKFHGIKSMIYDIIINNFKENIETAAKTDEIISYISNGFLYLFDVKSTLLIPNISKN